MKKITESNAARYTLILILVTFIARLLIAAYTGLGIGESYYFRGVLKFDLSYFDQPPLFFWLSILSTKVFGLTALGLRFPAVLMFAGTSWLLFLVTKRLFNAKAGFWAVVMMSLSAVFTVAIACWFQPDAPLMFFWMVCVYLIVKIMGVQSDSYPVEKLSSKQIYWLWILTGICLGLATLSKYHVVFMLAGVFLFVIANKDQRRWLTHPGPYIAVVIMVLITFPVLWWNYKNNWASFVFQGSRAGVEGDGGFQLHFDWLLRSVLGQAVWLLPWVWVPLIGQFYKTFKMRNLSKSYGFTFWMAVLPIVFFTIITIWANLQYHFHWQAPGYMMLFMPLGYAIDQSLNNESSTSRRTRRWLRFSVCFTVITIIVAGFHMVTGFWQSYGPKWVVSLGGGTKDPTIQGVDYDGLMTRFEKEGWIENKKVFAGSTRWWLAGKVDWALRGKKDIVCFNRDPRNLAFLVDPQNLVGQDAVIIGDDHDDDVKADATPFFDSITRLPDVMVVRGGITESSLQVYYCKNFHLPKTALPDYPLYRQLSGKAPFGK